MPIIYAVVARGSRVQVEYAATSGNFATIARKILERVQSESGADARRSYAYDGHVFHILVDDELIYMCMTTVAACASLPPRMGDGQLAIRRHTLEGRERREGRGKGESAAGARRASGGGTPRQARPTSSRNRCDRSFVHRCPFWAKDLPLSGVRLAAAAWPS